jgi:molybdopterin synthase sulfur carrier subunit
MVKVLIFGQTLRDMLKETEMEFELANPMTIRAFMEANHEKLFEALTLAERGQLLISVNKKVGTLETKLQDGDILKLTHQAHFSYEGARWQNP